MFQLYWKADFKCALLATLLTACATPNTSDPIRHGLELKIDKTAGKISKLHYHYSIFESEIASTAFPWRTIEVSDMPVPEYFEVSWYSEGGEKHEVRVPVRGYLPSSIKNNDVQFLIMQDTVEGYIVRFTPDGEKKERFY